MGETAQKAEQVAQLFIITPEQLTGYGSVTQAGSATREALRKYPVGGLIYFSGNLIDKDGYPQNVIGKHPDQYQIVFGFLRRGPVFTYHQS